MKIIITKKQILWSTFVLLLLVSLFSRNWIAEKIYQRSDIAREIAQDMECTMTVSEIFPEIMDLLFPNGHEYIHGFSYNLRLENKNSGNVKLDFWPNISLTNSDTRTTQFIFPTPDNEKNTYNTFTQQDMSSGKMTWRGGRMAKWDIWSMREDVFLTSSEEISLEELSKKPQIFVAYSRDYAPERVVFCTVSNFFPATKIFEE